VLVVRDGGKLRHGAAGSDGTEIKSEKKEKVKVKRKTKCKEYSENHGGKRRQVLVIE
jgi:hypothetical protein